MNEMPFQVPEQVREHVRNVFAHVNDRVTKKISLTPNVPEESLDIAFIENLSDFAGPIIVAPGWAVRIAAHFIGSIRHCRRYEIADIGVVVVFKKASTILRRKLVLLQSKRLYPLSHNVIEFDEYDYELGLALVTRDASKEASIFSTLEFVFDEHSRYGAIKSKNEQCTAIQEHFEQTSIPVHYMMYNPLLIPWRTAYPVSDSGASFPKRQFGTRVIDSLAVHQIIDAHGKNYSPQLLDFLGRSEGTTNDQAAFGWALEDFFANEVINCHQGYVYDREKDVGLQRLFGRKSGPIFCVVEITVEQP